MHARSTNESFGIFVCDSIINFPEPAQQSIVVLVQLALVNNYKQVTYKFDKCCQRSNNYTTLNLLFLQANLSRSQQRTRSHSVWSLIVQLSGVGRQSVNSNFESSLKLAEHFVWSNQFISEQCAELFAKSESDVLVTVIVKTKCCKVNNFCWSSGPLRKSRTRIANL